MFSEKLAATHHRGCFVINKRLLIGPRLALSKGLISPMTLLFRSLDLPYQIHFSCEIEDATDTNTAVWTIWEATLINVLSERPDCQFLRGWPLKIPSTVRMTMRVTSANGQQNNSKVHESSNIRLNRDGLWSMDSASGSWSIELLKFWFVGVLPLFHVHEALSARSWRWQDIVKRNQKRWASTR